MVDLNLRGEMAYRLVDQLLADGVGVVFATGYMGDSVASAYRHLPRWVKPYLPLTLAGALKYVTTG